MVETTVKIADITVPERIRKQYGDVLSLAKSIETHGLLNSITLARQADGSLRLVAGGRRLAAHQHLGRNEIRATILDEVDADSLSIIEVIENTKREGFTLEESVQAYEVILERSKRVPPMISAELQQCDDLAEDEPKAPPQKRALEAWAAREAGIGGRQTLYYAKKVVRAGCKELIALVNCREIPVSAAYKIAKFPSEQQHDLISVYQASAPRPESNAGRPKGSPNKKKVRTHVGSHKGPTYSVGMAWLGWRADDRTLPGHWPSITELKKRPVGEVMDMSASVVFMRVGARNYADGVAVLNAWGYILDGAVALIDDRLRNMKGDDWGSSTWLKRNPDMLLIGYAGEYNKGPGLAKRFEPYLFGKMPTAAYEMVDGLFPKQPKVDLFYSPDATGKQRKLWSKWLTV